MDRPIYAPNKGPPIRTSKFSLSSLKAIIRRKTKDDNAVVNKNPYPAQSRRDSKPFMSQPVLALSNPTQSLDIDVDDVSESDWHSAPSDHSSLTINRYPPQPHILSRPRKVSAQSNVSNSSFLIHDSLVKTQPTAVAVGTATLYPTQPANVKTSVASEESLSNSSKHGGLYKPLVSAVETPPKPASDRLPPIPTPSLSWSSSSSDDTVGPNNQVATTTPKVNKLYTSTNCSPAIMYSSTPALPSESSPATSHGRNSINSSHKTSHSPPSLSVLEDSSSTVPDASRRTRVSPKLTVNTTLDVSNNRNAGPNSIINTTSSQQPILPPIQPRRTVSGAPRLSLPPANYRFSLNLVDGYSARLSPSVILRPPPLPLLNLPMLSGSTGTDDASSRRSRRAGLMSMPALPRQGSSRGTAGHEEFDDVAEGDDEDEDDADGDGGGIDDDDGDDDTSLDSAPLEDEMDAPRSGYSSASETILSSHSRSCTPSLTPSYETAHAESSKSHKGYLDDLTRPPEKKISRTSFLPPVDMSRIDLSFLNSPPPSENKGKGKSKDLTEDAGRTPIAVVRPNRNSGPAGSSIPIAFSPMDFFIPEEAPTNTWATSPVLTKEGQALSPTQTPRAGGHFNFPLPVPIPPSPPSPRPIISTRLTDNRLSMNTITLFPGTYNRASRSLIDVHALEKKEKVEQMVREEEEGAEEERKRRVKVMRMSMRVESVNAIITPPDQQSNGDDIDNKDEQLKTSLHPDVPWRVSLAPNWVDGEDDLIKASQGGEASRPPVKQPKRTDNRISMAPAYDTIIPLRRRLSMPTFNSTSTSPPPYPDLFPGQTSYGIKPAQIQPRDDEGREKLPAYSNSIYLKAIMPRKLEFSRPGVQAKDRKWKRVLCVLEGTSLKVYKPPGVSTIGGWWENKVGTGDMAVPITTTSSFNSGNGGERAAVGVANAIEEGKEEMERERERMRTISTSSHSTPSNQRQGPNPTTSRSRHPSSATTNSSGSGNTPYTSTGHGVLPATKSALNLAVHLLKPSSRSHARTISDVGQSSNSTHQSPRSSLNIPRNGRSATPTPTIASTNTGTSSSRSASPMFASSSSLLTTSGTSSSSHRSTDSMSSSIGGGGSSAASRVFNNNVNRTAAPATSSSTSKGKKKVEDPDPEPHPHSLIKTYTMQQAECGLGTDYLKRKHVIRVRLEGEQFLLQAKDVDNVIEWIEGLQAATNVAMDLDERPMPRGPIFPRRRRRRRVVVSTTINTAGIPHHTTRRATTPTGTTPVDALQLAPPLV